MGLTLFAFALISGCGWFTGDGDDAPEAATSGGDTTAGGATTGDGPPDPKPAEECGGLASAIEKVMVEMATCSRSIPTEHVRKASVYYLEEDINEEEKIAVVEACGYTYKFVEDSGNSNCKSGNAASQLCYNKSVKWMEDLKSQSYYCNRAEAVPYSQVLEQQGYIKVNDKYVKD